MDNVAAIVGPTAVGKSKIAVEVAGKTNAEIISIDSVQIYKNFNIGSAKINKSEMVTKDGDLIKHYLIDTIEPTISYSVADYKRLAEEAIAEINKKGKLPLLVGGTGLYLQSIIDPYKFTEQKIDWDLRKKLQSEAEERGNLYLHEKLAAVDKISAEKFHPNDVKRVSRALEVFYTTGEPIWKNHFKEEEVEAKYNVILIGIYMERQKLYERINKRVDVMIKDGLIEEVQSLLNNNISIDHPAMQSLGYKQIIEYLQNKCTIDKAIDDIKKETRHFAKRQLTWFRRDKRINWYEISENMDINNLINEITAKIGRTIKSFVE